MQLGLRLEKQSLFSARNFARNVGDFFLKYEHFHRACLPLQQTHGGNILVSCCFWSALGPPGALALEENVLVPILFFVRFVEEVSGFDLVVDIRRSLFRPFPVAIARNQAGKVSTISS